MLDRLFRIAVLMFVCVPVTAWNGTDPPPKLLLDAARCLSTKGFLPASMPKMLTSGYLIDSKSYPGDTVLYVVVYSTQRRSEGFVFSIFLANNRTHKVFNIQNNGRFVRSHVGPAPFKKDDIDFPDPPLGGIWTQEHIAHAIKQIGYKKTFSIPVKDVASLPTSGECESYADAR